MASSSLVKRLLGGLLALLTLTYIFAYWTSTNTTSALKSTSVTGSHAPLQGRFAFATLLSDSVATTVPPNSAGTPQDPNAFYLGTRYLNWILRSFPETKSRSKKEIPLLVLATPDVDESKLERLAREGAQIVRYDPEETPSWMAKADARYREALLKLKLWQLADYDKICFIGSNVMILSPMDGIFGDPATTGRRTVQDRALADAPGLPPKYAFAAPFETFDYEHPIPVHNEKGRLSSNLFVMSPDDKMYELYLSQLQQTFSRSKVDYYPEQEVFNAVHDKAGPMPWSELDWKWNTNNPSQHDLDARIISFHDTFWTYQEGGEPQADWTLKKVWSGQVELMDDFYKEQEL